MHWRNTGGGGGGAARGGGHLYSAAISLANVFTTPIGTPTYIYIYIWPRAAIPPAPPLDMLVKCMLIKYISGFFYIFYSIIIITTTITIITITIIIIITIITIIIIIIIIIIMMMLMMMINNINL